MSFKGDAASKRRKPRGGHKNLYMLLDEYTSEGNFDRDFMRRADWDAREQLEFSRRDPKREKVRLRIPQEQ